MLILDKKGNRKHRLTPEEREMADRSIPEGTAEEHEGVEEPDDYGDALDDGFAMLGVE